MNLTADLAVIGGGVIGCSIAYHAARRGARVTLLEAEQIGSGASGAAAGMLAAQSEAHEPGPFLNLLLHSRELHKKLDAEVRETSGLDPEYIWEGTLRAASDTETYRALHNMYVWQKGEGLSTRWLEAEEAHDLEPNLSPEVAAALYLPGEGQVNSPQLVRAFSLGAIRRGATVLEGTRVTGFSTERRRVVGVETTQGRVSAGTVAFAGGVPGAPLADELGIHLPVYPVKGEILAVNAIPAPIKANVWDNRCYLVPKKDGRVIVGATEEPGVYDRRPTLGGVSFLCGQAVKLIPDLFSAHFATAWGGLRPGTPSGEPILGPVEGWEGLLVATGHYRNGVLLSPVTGEIISALALDEPSPVDISPFLYTRAVESATR